MKSIILTLLLFITVGLSAQTFSDNFDSYTTSDYIGNQTGWTTWSGTAGGGDDLLVSDADSHSPSNSLYFASTAASGGPVDIVKDFGGELNTGQFDLSMYMKVETGKVGFFNFQKNTTIGTVWALNVNFTDQGELTLSNGTGTTFTTQYTQGVWFKFELNIDLSLNEWEVLLDGVSKGTFASTDNQIASINLYPVQNSGFYVDDFEYTYTPYSLPTLNGAATNLATNKLLAGQQTTPVATVRNLGTSAITSFDLTIDYNGTSYTDNITGQNLASLETMDVTGSQVLTLAAGSNNATVTISNVNGMANDDDPSDDVKVLNYDPVVPAPGKMVVSEEGTGTWCGWCPRGAVGMDNMGIKYDGFWVGIAVHNGDPMVDATYDAGIGALISGYPSALVDRGGDVDPNSMDTDFLTRIQIAPKATIVNGATWDAATRILDVSVTSSFNSAADNNYKIALVLTEDDVTGTTSGYNQANYYSNSQDLMDPAGYNWRNLPDPVPAAQMVYNHVARGIYPSFGGFSSSFPSTVNSGDTHTVTFQVEVPAGWDENNIHIVSLLIDPAGKIDNAASESINDAVTNGYVMGTSGGVFTDIADNKVDASFDLFPNPASDYAVLSLNLEEQSDVTVTISNIAGQVLTSRNYGSMSGASTINLNTAAMSAGIYVINCEIDGHIISKKLIVK